jgi:hypothetical protein
MNATKIASLVAGVAVIAIAAFATSLPAEARAGLLLLGGFLCGYPMTPPGAGKPVGATLALLLALSPALPACSSQPEPASAAEVASRVRDVSRLAYHGGVITLGALEDARVEWMKAQANPTPEAVAIAQKVNDLLHAAKDGLDRVKPWLETGEGEDEAKQRLRETLELLNGAAGLLLSNGGPVSKGLTDGLQAALAALGSGS